MKRSKKLDYDVGYRKPPAHSRFQPGRSGNPKGRPKGTESLNTELNRLLKEKIEIIENGRRKKVTKAEALMKGLINRALKGDAKALQQVLAMLKEQEDNSPWQPITIVLDAADAAA